MEKNKANLGIALEILQAHYPMHFNQLLHDMFKKTSLLRENFGLLKKFIVILMGQNDLVGLLKIVQRTRH